MSHTKFELMSVVVIVLAALAGWHVGGRLDESAQITAASSVAQLGETTTLR